MVSIERFVYASFNGVGWTFVKSPRVNQWVNPDSLEHLIRQGSTKETVTQTPLENGKIAYSYLRPAKDEDNRPSFYNYTIIMGINDLLKLLNAEKFIEQFLIKNMTNPPKSLESIQIEEG